MLLFPIEKEPALSTKQGMYRVVNAAGTILKRGYELRTVLKVFKKTLKLVE